MKKISHRFANVLIEVALKENSATEVLNDFNDVAEIFSDSEILSFFNNHLVPKESKIEVIKEFMKERRPEIVNLLTVLLNNDHFKLFKDIHEQYEILYNQALKRVEVEVTTAYQLDNTQIEALKKAIDARFEIDSIIDVEVDTSLIQGINFRIGDLVYQGSLRKSLDELEHHLRKGIKNVAEERGY